jgi:FMN reductase (NADPH)
VVIEMPHSSADVRQFFQSHWTVRKYKTYKIPDDHLDTILYAAQHAPTDATAQMYSIIRLVDSEVRARAAELSGNSHIATASEAFIICADVHRLARILKTKGEELSHTPEIHIHFALGDAVLAGQNLLLAAEMLGYQGCWIGGVLTRLEEMSALIKLPEGVFPFAGLTIGLPDEPPQSRPRIEREHVVHVDHYRDPSDEQLQKSINAMAPITARGDWAQTLARYFAVGGTMEERNGPLKKYLDRQLGR